MKNTIILTVIGVLVVLGCGVLLGHALAPSTSTIVGAAVQNSAGTTFNTAKVAEITMNPSSTSAGATATTSSILNTDATDRVITDSFVSCNGTGVSSTGQPTVNTWVWNMATTSASAPANAATLNTNLAGSLVVSTSSADIYAASSTSFSVGGDYIRRWAAGSYLTIFTNATNTATCQVGVHYLAS